LGKPILCFALAAACACACISRGFAQDTQPASAETQSATQATVTPLTLYTTCFGDALARKEVAKEGPRIRFTCEGNAAQSLFETLQRYGYPMQHHVFSKLGEFQFLYLSSAIARQGHDDWCLKKIVDGSGRTLTIPEYSCDLWYAAGDLLNR
jgi:hypothetical protein